MKVMLFALMLILTGCENINISNQITEKITTMDNIIELTEWLNIQEKPENLNFSMIFVDEEGNTQRFIEMSEIYTENIIPLDYWNIIEFKVIVEAASFEQEKIEEIPLLNEYIPLIEIKDEILKEKIDSLDDDLNFGVLNIKKDFIEIDAELSEEKENNLKKNENIFFHNPALEMSDQEAINQLRLRAEEEWKDNGFMIDMEVKEGMDAFYRLQTLQINCEIEERYLKDIWNTWSKSWSGFNPSMIEKLFFQEIEVYTYLFNN